MHRWCVCLSIRMVRRLWNGRLCEGFRMTAHHDDSACTGAVVRKPPVKERA
jgi:hypothetical protein